MKELAELNAIYQKMSTPDVDEAMIVTNADKKGNTPAYQAYKAGKKNVKTGEPLYKAADHMKEEEISPIDSVLSPEELERVAQISKDYDAAMEEGYKGTMDMSKSHPEAVKKVEDNIAKHFGKKRVPGGKMGVKEDLAQEGSAYGMYKGSGKPSGAMAAFGKAPRMQKGAMAYDGPNKASSEAKDRILAKTKAKREAMKK